MRISDWSSDVCSSDLPPGLGGAGLQRRGVAAQPDQSVLDAAAAGRARPARARQRRFQLPAAAGAYPAGSGVAVGAGVDAHACAAGDALRAGIGDWGLGIRDDTTDVTLAL